MKKFLSALFIIILAFGCVSGVAQETAPKYVFLFIGDGMGLPQVTLAQYFLGAMSRAEGEAPAPKELNFTAFEALGLMTNYSLTSSITDSAASGTAMACGVKAHDGFLGIDGAYQKAKNLAEYAREAGRKVGIITSVTVDHATPAAFYAHVSSRELYAAIFREGIKNKTANFLAGGGVLFGSVSSAKRITDKSEWQMLSTREEILALEQGAENVVVFDPAETPTGGLMLEIDRLRREKEGEEHFSLADYVEMGIEFLDNEQGFFMMCEGGQIDWACHANDGATTAYEVLAFADAIQVALDFEKAHPGEVLIVVTADHETGGMTLGGANTGYDTHFDYLSQQTISYAEFDNVVLQLIRKKATFEEALAEVEKYFGLNQRKDDPLCLNETELAHLEASWELSRKVVFEHDAISERLYGDYEPFGVAACRVLDRKAALSFTTFKHTALPVPVYAHGAGAEAFAGFYDNTNLFQLLFDAMRLKKTE